MPKWHLGLRVAASLFVITFFALSSFFLIRQNTTPSSLEAATTSTVSIIPDSSIMPPSQEFKIMVGPSTANIGFARVVVEFDPTKLKLVSALKPNTYYFDTVVQQTSVTKANADGRIIFVAAGSPQNTKIPPTSAFEIASFELEPVTGTASDSTTISLKASDMQLVDFTAKEVSFTVKSATVKLNPLSGDADYNGKVDGVDYMAWKSHYNQATTDGAPAGDFDSSGKVDGIDYMIWKNHYTA